MIDLESRWKAAKADIDDVNDWVEHIYMKYFKDYFQQERDLYQRLKSNDNPITDTELEWILTDLPLELFSVADALSKFRVTKEVIKLKNKENEAAQIQLSTETSATKKKEQVQLNMVEDALLLSVVDIVAGRVESEISFSKELIMSAKKIWDARRRQEDTGTIENSVSNKELPDYPQTYIR